MNWLSFLRLIFNNHIPLRYGKKEGFKNKDKKRVHDVGTRFQQACDVSLHENVPEYEEEL